MPMAQVSMKRKNHYENYGFSEGRVIDNFDELAYVAIHTRSYGRFWIKCYSVEFNGLQHYLNFGIKENRRSSVQAQMFLHI